MRRGPEEADTLRRRRELHAGAAARLSPRRAAPGTYRELLNSDADVYGGSNIGNTARW